MIGELEASLDPSISREFGTLGNDARVKRATAGLEANGIKVLRAAGAERPRPPHVAQPREDRVRA